MRAVIRIGVDAPGEAELGAAAQTAADAIGEDLTVTNTGYELEGQPYTVVGTRRGKPDERWSVVVQASSAEEAEQLAVDEDEQRAVAAVVPGVLELGEGGSDEA